MASMQVKPIRLGNHFSSGSEFAVLKGTGKVIDLYLLLDMLRLML